MFDTTKSFTKQFTPYEDGYLYYPSRKGGGRLVSEAEYQSLKANWQVAVGTKGIWKIVGITVLVVALKVAFWPDAVVGSVVIWAMAPLIVAHISWAASAPSRLVKGRPDIASPRPLAATKAFARSLIPWRMVIQGFLFSAGLFVLGLFHHPQTLLDWLWLIGSGTMCAASGWIGVQKFRDRKTA